MDVFLCTWAQLKSKERDELRVCITGAKSVSAVTVILLYKWLGGLKESSLFTDLFKVKQAENVFLGEGPFSHELRYRRSPQLEASCD